MPTSTKGGLSADETQPQHALDDAALEAHRHDEPRSEEDHRARLWDIVEGFDEAMLVTRTEEGALRGRPLAVGRVERAQHTLHFLTSIDSPKVSEVEAYRSVAVVLQGKARFVTLSGEGRVVRDRAAVDALWGPFAKAFFPKGKDDPALCVLEVRCREAEYWDLTSPRVWAGLLSLAKNLFVSDDEAGAEHERAHPTPNKVRLT